MNLNIINKHKSILHRSESASKRKNKTFWKKINIQSAENHKCYNCEIIEYLVRDCKKSHCKRKELVTMNKRVVHNQLSWTACYNNMCWIHQSEKDETEWYLQRSCKKHEDYNTTKWLKLRSEVKKLIILKKEEIKEIDTHRMQIEN